MPNNKATINITILLLSIGSPGGGGGGAGAGGPALVETAKAFMNPKRKMIKK